jgi:Fe-S-cluster containining protein
MKYCEASSIIDHIWATQTKEFKKKILITAIRYYFSDSLVKPCMLLEGKTCAEYARRSLNCRLYGLWPSDSWEDRVKMFSKATGLPREKLPLNTQCPNVKRAKQVCKDCKDLTDAEKTACKACGGTGWITPPPLTSEQISALFEQLDKADTVLGISELKVSTSWNYRTFHDWVLLKFWGENALSQWTNIILNTSPEQRHNLVEAVVEQANKMDV